jgi:hypothetical protein
VMLNQWYHMLHLHCQWISCEIDDHSERIRASFTGQLPFSTTQLLLRSSINLLLDSSHLHSHAQACNAFGSLIWRKRSQSWVSLSTLSTSVVQSELVFCSPASFSVF